MGVRQEWTYDDQKQLELTLAGFLLGIALVPAASADILHWDVVLARSPSAHLATTPGFKGNSSITK